MSAGLSVARYNIGAMASPDAGYFGGGYYPWKATVDRFLFSNDSRTTLGTGLSQTRQYPSGFASSVAGYFVGGHEENDGYVDTVDRFLFSNDSRSILSTGLSNDGYGGGSFASSVAGYFAGGPMGSGHTAAGDKVAV